MENITVKHIIVTVNIIFVIRSWRRFLSQSRQLLGSEKTQLVLSSEHIFVNDDLN